MTHRAIPTSPAADGRRAAAFCAIERARRTPIGCAWARPVETRRAEALRLLEEKARMVARARAEAAFRAR